ncbi:hypothetical protein DI43_03595 [Geobacillus sp. CAMR12739]|nr:hypothetical protein DI43_03595 [Geobacillus sp. CAMR12739]
MKKKKNAPPQRPISQLWEKLRQSSDFVELSFIVGGKELSIYYFDSLVDPQVLQERILCHLQNDIPKHPNVRLEDLQQIVPIQRIEVSEDAALIEENGIERVCRRQLLRAAGQSGAHGRRG